MVTVQNDRNWRKVITRCWLDELILPYVRIPGHGLKCETGLYGRSPDRSARVCNLCENRDIQDEKHVNFLYGHRTFSAPVQPFI